MALDDLVKTITQEVLKQIQKTSAQPQVLILSGRDCANIQPVLQQLGQGPSVSFWDPDSQYPASVRMILPLLSCSQMADLALGRATGSIMGKVLSTLLSGGTVEVFEYEYLRYRDTAPEGLFSLYCSYEETLLGFGLKRFVTEATNVARLSKSLVTERDIIEAHQRGDTVLHVHSDAKLTPLALDCARERGIQLQTIER